MTTADGFLLGSDADPKTSVDYTLVGVAGRTLGPSGAPAEDVVETFDSRDGEPSPLGECSEGALEPDMGAATGAVLDSWGDPEDV